jgi:acyl-CoA carboxylase subunit beta
MSLTKDAPPIGLVAAVEGVEVIQEWDLALSGTDPLGFPDYTPPAEESVRTGLARIGDRQVALVQCRFANSGGTMGAVAGERVVRAFARATEQQLPVVEIVSTGGARLQEGMVALVQMARTASAAARHQAAGLMSMAVLRSPTTGGVFASWASLADLRAAEPQATIGFAGPRVVAQVTGMRLPTTSHTAESAHAAGLVDALVPREDTLAWLQSVLGQRRTPLVLPASGHHGRQRDDVPTDPAAVLQRTRSRHRPSGLEWAGWLTDSWVALQGSDPAVRAGLATVGTMRLVVVAMDRHAFGDGAARLTPAAFRLARRAIELAGRLNLPVLTLIDTPGAEPGPAAEADGIAREIAQTLRAMAVCPTPTVALTVGEGGSGGAMAFAHADRLFALSGSVFSVIGPEAGAAILYRDAARAVELTRAFRMTAQDLARMGVVDQVFGETAPEVVTRIRAAVVEALTLAVPGDRERRIDALTRRALLT